MQLGLASLEKQRLRSGGLKGSGTTEAVGGTPQKHSPNLGNTGINISKNNSLNQ